MHYLLSQAIIYFGSRSEMVFHLCKRSTRSSQEQYWLIHSSFDLYSTVIPYINLYWFSTIIRLVSSFSTIPRSLFNFRAKKKHICILEFFFPEKNASRAFLSREGTNWNSVWETFSSFRGLVRRGVTFHVSPYSFLIRLYTRLISLVARAQVRVITWKTRDPVGFALRRCVQPIVTGYVPVIIIFALDFARDEPSTGRG